MLIEVIGASGAQFEEGFEHTHSGAAGKIGPIKHFFISLERNDAITLGYFFGAQVAQLVGKHTFQSEEGLSRHFKFVSHHVLFNL